jgi:hypothetical protein
MPDPTVIIGTQGYVEQPIERTNDPRRGPSTTRRFKGQRNDLLSIKATFDAAGWSTRFTAGPVCNLEATIGQDVDGVNPPVDQPIDTWELGANVAEKDILTADTTLVNTAMASVNDSVVLRDLIKGGTKFEDIASGDFETGAGWAIAKLISGGVQSILTYQPILRHNKTVSNVYEIPNSLSNVGSVLLTSTLITQETIPSRIANSLPASGAEVSRGGYSGYRYGWLKAYPTITESGYNKTTIAQEWQWGLWPTDLFNVL